MATATAKLNTYTAFKDFSFKLNRKTYSAKEGETFSPPEDLTEVPGDPKLPKMRDGKVIDAPAGLKFQYLTYVKTVSEEKGEESELEIPKYMILPLSKS